MRTRSPQELRTPLPSPSYAGVQTLLPSASSRTAFFVVAACSTRFSTPPAFFRLLWGPWDCQACRSTMGLLLLQQLLSSVPPFFELFAGVCNCVLSQGFRSVDYPPETVFHWCHLALHLPGGIVLSVQWDDCCF